MSERRDYLHLHFIVFLWGFTAILGLLITIPSVEIVFYRTGLAALALLIIMIVKGLSFKVHPRWLILMIFNGVLIGAHWILFFGAARVSTASVCLAGMATISFWTSILEPLAIRKKIKSYELLLGIIVIAGLYVIFRFEFNHALGLALALGSAFLAALFTVINLKFTHRYHHQSITFYEMMGANVSILLFFPFYARYFTDNGLQLIPNFADWVYLLILALVCTVYAYSQAVSLMKRITAFGINLTVNLEPVYGIILAVIIFPESEKMNAGFYLGTIIILAAVLSYPVINRWRKRRATVTDNLR
ncbi:MAG: DMT family transporter [Cyclobacteriaceae bacterium]